MRENIPAKCADCPGDEPCQDECAPKSQTWTPEKRALDASLRRLKELTEDWSDNAALDEAIDAVLVDAAHILPDEREGSQMAEYSRVTP